VTHLDTPGQRLRAVMKYYRHTQQTLGQLLGVSKGYLSVMMNDKEPITTKVVLSLIKSFTGLNTHWLLTGEGEMLLDVHADILGVVAEPEAGYERSGMTAEGRLEWMERMIRELDARVKELEGKGCGKDVDF
jgi:hypothetical protein